MEHVKSLLRNFYQHWTNSRICFTPAARLEVYQKLLLPGKWLLCPSDQKSTFYIFGSRKCHLKLCFQLPVSDTCWKAYWWVTIPSTPCISATDFFLFFLEYSRALLFPLEHFNYPEKKKKKSWSTTTCHLWLNQSSFPLFFLGLPTL